MTPAVNTDKLRVTVCTQRRTSSWPTIILLNPVKFITPHRWCCEGLRISASTSNTRFPACANDAAKLAETSDLPSPGTELVMTIVRTFLWLMNLRLAWSIWYASWITERGEVATITRCEAPSRVVCSIALLVSNLGINPSRVYPNNAWASLTVLSDRSIKSIKKAAATPSNSPTNPPPAAK